MVRFEGSTTESNRIKLSISSHSFIGACPVPQVPVHHCILRHKLLTTDARYYFTSNLTNSKEFFSLILRGVVSCSQEVHESSAAKHYLPALRAVQHYTCEVHAQTAE